MSDNPTSPLLGEEERREDGPVPQRPLSQRSRTSTRSQHSRQSERSDESTPLLSRSTEERSNEDNEGANGEAASPAASFLRSLQGIGQGQGKKGRRWPTIVALSVLSVIVIVILGLGFAAPALVQEYAKQAMVFEPTDLSIISFTSSGVIARVQGDFTLDASRVHKNVVRDLGRAGTWIARAVESKDSQLKVYLPEYGNILLGTAEIPSIVVSIRNGHTTHIDFPTDLKPGDIGGIRSIANDWLDGRLGQLRVQGQAKVPLKSGIFGLGTHSVSETLLFEGHDLPAIPKYNITKMNFHEVKLSETQKGMAADVALTAVNDYPVTFTVPRLAFDILVPNCSPDDPHLLLANATTEEIQVKPKQKVDVNVGGVIRQLPRTLTAVCPNTNTSPLDLLLGNYIQGMDTTIYVQGANSSPPDTPSWITELLKSVMVPLPFPGRSFNGLIRDFSLANVHLGLPSPFADPDKAEGQPKISATVKALVNLPQEMNFPIEVSRVRADADVFYHGKKLGVLNLRKWQKANSTRIDAEDDEQAGLAVESIVKDAPLEVTDDDVFADVVQALLFGGKQVVLAIKANVDVETVTALGQFIVRQIPAEGNVPVKPISGGGLEGFAPKVGSLRILETTMSTLLIEAKVNVTNPTNYSATVPYVNINILSNGTVLGHAVATDVAVVPGPNNDIPVKALWDPLGPSGSLGVDVGRELLSQYISGFNTTLTLKTHHGTIPTQPRLGEALSSINISIPTPRLTAPKNPNHPDDDDDDGDGRDDNAPHFIDDATFHLFSSTATFTLLSPLPHSTLYVTHINATAYYNHTDPVGEIFYDLPFAVPPGASTSPRLPVDWSADSVGYEAVKQALGGSLKLDARATVGVRVGQWEERVWFTGGGIGASVRI